MKTPSNQTRVRKEKPVIIYNLSVNNYCSLNHFLSYGQFLVAWTLHSCTAKGRSPDWTLWRFDSLPGLPVVSKQKLTKYGDEFVQDSHLFPFSPVQISHVVPLIIHNQDAIIHLTDTSRICIKLYVTTGSFYHTYINASRNVINWGICPHFRLWFPPQKWYNIPQRQNL